MYSYSIDDICAVIVTYNPDIDVLKKNIESLSKQVNHCLIVDNGSQMDFEVDCQNNWITKLCLNENKGIAYALNEGLKYCTENGYKLLLSMDQDSILYEEAVNELLVVINRGVDSAGINWDNRCEEDKEVEFLITSGNLLKTEALNTINGYDTNLFIDSVDFDVSLRLKDAGYKLVKVYRARATHEIGVINKKAKLLGIIPIKYYSHTPERYYYISRNHYYILKKFNKTHSIFCIKKRIHFIIDIIKLILIDTEKRKKITAIKKGKKVYHKLEK